MANKSIYLERAAAGNDGEPQLVPDAAVRGDFLFSSGIAGFDVTGQLPESNAEQGALAFERLSQILKLADFSAEEIGHLFVWALERHPVVGGKVTQFINPHWEKMFPLITDRPARHVLGRVLDSGMHYRLEIVAVKNARRKCYEINDIVYHTGGSTTKGYMPFGITIGRYLYTGPTYGMPLDEQKVGDTPARQAELCQTANEVFYRMAGHSRDELAQMFVWYHDRDSKQAAIDHTERMFPAAHDRPAIHYLNSRLPLSINFKGQFYIQYDITGVGGERRKALHLPGVSVMDGEQGRLPAGVVMGNTLFSSVLIGHGSFEEQVREAFGSARTVVEAGGFDWRDVGHVYVWYDDHERRGIVDKVWAEVFPRKDERPARHCVQEPELPASTLVGVEIRAAR